MQKATCRFDIWKLFWKVVPNLSFWENVCKWKTKNRIFCNWNAKRNSKIPQREWYCAYQRQTQGKQNKEIRINLIQREISIFEGKFNRNMLTSSFSSWGNWSFVKWYLHNEKQLYISKSKMIYICNSVSLSREAIWKECYLLTSNPCSPEQCTSCLRCL